MGVFEDLYFRDLNRFLNFQLIERIAFELKLYYEIHSYTEDTLNVVVDSIYDSANFKKEKKEFVIEKAISYLNIKYDLVIENDSPLRIKKSK